jgi:hypothetical protein
MPLTQSCVKFKNILAIQLIFIILIQLPILQHSFGQMAQEITGDTVVYENKDFGFKLSYPSSWTVKEDNLFFNTVVSFTLIDTNIYDYTNRTIAEVDIRIFPTYANRTANDISLNDVNTSKQLILNATNGTLGGHRSLDIVDYTFEDSTRKHFQVWTVLPKHDALLLIYYIAEPGVYPQYLNVVQSMIKSFKFIG